MWKVVNIVIIGVLLYGALLSTPTEAKFNFAKFREMFFVKRLIRKVKPLGLVGRPPLKFNVVNKELKIIPNPRQLINPISNGPKQADIVKGKGMGLKSYRADFMVELPVEKPVYNYCGMVLTALTTLKGGPFTQMRIFWRKPGRKWEIVNNPKTGEPTFFIRMRAGLMTRSILFDSLPATHFRIWLIGMPGRNLNVRMAFLKGCYYRNRITIKNCGEKIDGNVRFKDLPVGIPIHVKCPLNCIRTWPCWGWQIYSTDSPICWTATQSMGRTGSGVVTMYKIPAVLYFRQNINSLETNGIYCRRSTVHYTGYTFERRFYDFAKTEYRDNMGA